VLRGGKKRLLLPLGWAGVIFYLSSQSGTGLELPFLHADKWIHAGIYGVLAALFLWAVGGNGPKALGTLVGLVSLYGATDEVHQYFVPGRSTDVWDWVADTVGALVVALLYYLARWSRLTREES